MALATGGWAHNHIADIDEYCSIQYPVLLSISHRLLQETRKVNCVYFAENDSIFLVLVSEVIKKYIFSNCYITFHSQIYGQ